jgi:photoprotection regulator FRP-like protein
MFPMIMIHSLWSWLRMRPMDSSEQFINHVPWSPGEKKAARRAFDDALGRHLSAIIAEAKRRMANVADPSDLWELEAYLTESRRTVDRLYQYRYSDLLRVFAILVRDGWLKETDLVGLQSDKIAKIKDGAEVFRRIFNHTDEIPKRSWNLERSTGFDSDAIIHGFAESLLAAQIFLCGLNRDVTQQEVNLLRFATWIVTEAGAGSPEIVRGEFRDSQTLPRIPWPHARRLSR